MPDLIGSDQGQLLEIPLRISQVGLNAAIYFDQKNTFEQHLSTLKEVIDRDKKSDSFSKGDLSMALCSVINRNHTHANIDGITSKQLETLIHYFKSEGLDMDRLGGLFDEAPIHRAVATGNITAVKALLSCGASIDNELSNQMTPFLLAVRMGQVNIAELLRLQGAKVSQMVSDIKNNALHYAVQSHREDMVRYLVTLSVDAKKILSLLKQKNYIGRTPYEIARAEGVVNLADYLQGAQVALEERLLLQEMGRSKESSPPEASGPSSVKRKVNML